MLSLLFSMWMINKIQISDIMRFMMGHFNLGDPYHRLSFQRRKEKESTWEGLEWFELLTGPSFPLPSFWIFSNSLSSKEKNEMLPKTYSGLDIHKLTSAVCNSSRLLTLFHFNSFNRHESFLTCPKDDYKSSIVTSLQDWGPSMCII